MKLTTFAVVLFLALAGLASAQVLTPNVNTNVVAGTPSTNVVDVSGAGVVEPQNQNTTTAKSNTNSASSGFFKSDIDFVVHPTDYAKLNQSFVAWLGSTPSSFYSTATSDLIVAWGNKSGDLYTGLYFDGNNLSNQLSVNGDGTNQKSTNTNSFDTFGKYTGQSVQTTTNKKWTDSSNDLVIGTVGLGGLGALTTGFGFKYNVVTGDIDPTTVAGTVSANSTGSVITNTYDASGNPLQTFGTSYTQNTYNTSVYGGGLFYGNTFNLGGGTSLKGYVGSNVNYANNVAQGGLTTYTQNYNTPLPTVGGYSNASYYQSQTGNLNGSYLEISPIANVSFATPVDDTTTFTTQVWYELDAFLYNNSYTDQNGASQTGGYAFYSTTNTTSVTNNGANYSTTTTSTNAYNNDNINRLNNAVKLNLQLTHVVSDLITVGLNYKPTFVYTNVTDTFSGASKSTVSYVANNQVATPASDYTQVTTITDASGQKTSWEAKLTNPIALGAQINVVPKVFIVFTGVTVTAPSFDLTGSTTSVQSQGSQTVVQTKGDGTTSNGSGTPGVNGQTFGGVTDQSKNTNQVSTPATTSTVFNLGANYFLTPDVIAEFAFNTGNANNGGNIVNIAALNLGLIVRY